MNLKVLPYPTIKESQDEIKVEDIVSANKHSKTPLLKKF